jgi:enoyl-CoA hydratase/carnithine racemase
MKRFQGQALSWEWKDGVIELGLHRDPCNEIGSLTLGELERFSAALDELTMISHAVILHSMQPAGFCAGADLRELFAETQKMRPDDAVRGVRGFLERIHAVFNKIDASPLTTIAAVHGVAFGGGFELALVCDLIVADRMARFCFPELRLGLIPGFGGIPRLKRDLGNSFTRDLLLTGRSFNAAKAHQIGLVSQLVAEGEALNTARATAAQVGKFDRQTSAVAKRFIKPLPLDELRQEIEIFCKLFTQPAVEAGLRRFAESKEALPYLP